MAKDNNALSACTQNSGTKSNKKTQGEIIRQALLWVLKDRIFADFQPHGNTNWQPKFLVALAVLTAWTNETQVTEAFGKAKRLSDKLFGIAAVKTYQGMMRALVTWTSYLLPVIWMRLQFLMMEVGGSYHRIGMWLPLAVDGSRFSTPRTQGNEIAFGAKNYGKGKDARSRCKWKNKRKRSKKKSQPVKPQIWLTLIWHMGLKLPWCWKTGPSNSSERHHLLEMLEKHIFPKNTLFCADAGFVGYDLWSAIVDHGHSFLIRVGGNVRLLKNLGHVQQGNGIVWLWPSKAVKKKQAPLILRLIKLKSPEGDIYLVTNVLSERQLNVNRVSSLYKARWGIELQFRGVKQTFGRSKLKSHNPDHALAELDWSLVALTIVQLFTIREQIKIDVPPEKSSVALALRAIRHAMDQWYEHAATETALPKLLQTAVKDDCNRESGKAARYKPNYKDKPKATKPKILIASKQQKAAYSELNIAC
jgi:hypothetical protein